MSDDSIRMDVPIAAEEITLLTQTKVGDVRVGKFLPALPANIKWTCSHVSLDKWEFEGYFCGQLVTTIQIAMLNKTLVLNVVKEAKCPA